MCWPPVTSGAARVGWPARSSSPSWAATSRSSTNKPTATARKSRPPATTCHPPTPPSAAAGPNPPHHNCGPHTLQVCGPQPSSGVGDTQKRRCPLLTALDGPARHRGRRGSDTGVTSEGGSSGAATNGPSTVLPRDWVGARYSNLGSYRCFAKSTTHIGEHHRQPVGGAIHGERIRVMTRRRCTPQGRGERI